MLDLIEKANLIHLKNHSNKIDFERGVFLSWFCSKADCNFCYMSLLKGKIDPRKARRTISSILAEVAIVKSLNWKVEFLSTGYHSHSLKELIEITKQVSQLYGEKVWLNYGYMPQSYIEALSSYSYGINASIESINPEIRKISTPSKPIEKFLETFDYAKNLKRSITIVVGLGETLYDIPKLHDFINEYKIDRITFYALIPHKGLPHNSGPSTKDYCEWIARTRIAFPKLNIVAGTRLSNLDEIHLILKSGANSLTKFQAIKHFNSPYALKIEKEIEKAGRAFTGSFTNMPKLEISNDHIKNYVKQMEKPKLV